MVRDIGTEDGKRSLADGVAEKVSQEIRSLFQQRPKPFMGSRWHALESSEARATNSDVGSREVVSA